MIEFCKVIFLTFAPLALLKLKFSSSAQLIEQWSNMIFSTVPDHAVTLTPSVPDEAVGPGLNLRFLIITLESSTCSIPPLIKTPSPGAVCPATVTFPS